MSKLTAYTIELYKADKRIKKDERYGKNKVGLRFVKFIDFDPTTRAHILTVQRDFEMAGYVAQVHETFVTRTNMMSGREMQERYDLPYYCSPSSESYWSM